MKFHLVTLPGRPVTRENSSCALTQSARKFSEMMTARGHEVVLYGGPEHDVKCSEYVECWPTLDEPPEFTKRAWARYNVDAIGAINDHAEGHDNLLFTAGNCVQDIVDAFPEFMRVEYAVAYAGVCESTHKVFESYPWMHTIYGASMGAYSADGQFFDTVIHPYMEIPKKPKLNIIREEYVLFCGRMIDRKGVQIASEAAARAGVNLLFVGEGNVNPPYGELLGGVGPDTRNELMANATAVLCPSLYIEPGCHTAIEAQMVGTPVISTDWGAFVDTVVQGETGFRCRTLREFSEAIETASILDRRYIREQAIRKYAMPNVAPEYERYFERIETLWGDGWYA